MSKGNIKLLLVVLAVAILGLTYLYVYKPNMSDVDSINSDIDTLEDEYDSLNQLNLNRDQYTEDIANYQQGINDILAIFPATLDQELTVMFMKNVDADEDEFNLKSVGLGQQTEFYALGGAATDSTGTADAASSTGYSCVTSIYPISYEGSYEGIKSLVYSIMTYKYRMNIDSISITYDSDKDLYSGQVSLNGYAINGEGREPDTVNPEAENGVDNIFLGGDGALAPTTYAYDADNGTSIGLNHNLFISLSNANSDGADGVIVAADSNNADTYVTSADNNVANVELSLYTNDGKTYAKYEMGDASYEVEVTTNDFTIYVDSSERVDAEDVNGIKLNITNDTSLDVFIKVSGDDTSSPRFELGSKTGTVKVY